jgi:hypothetical protein
MKKILLLHFLLISINNSFAVFSQNEFPCKAIVNSFAKLIENQKYSEATNLLLETNPIFFSDFETKNRIKLGLERTEKNYGILLSVDFLEIKQLGSKTVYFSIIANHEIRPVFYNLLFYKPKDVWMFIQINYEVDFKNFTKNNIGSNLD